MRVIHWRGDDICLAFFHDNQKLAPLTIPGGLTYAGWKPAVRLYAPSRRQLKLRRQVSQLAGNATVAAVSTAGYTDITCLRR